MSETKIEWTDKTWNPCRGCSLVSAGCRACYAMKQGHRFSGPGGKYEGLTELGPNGPRWTGRVVCDEKKLLEPLKWKKPQRVFVNSMSDLFHADVPDAFIDRVFAVMALTPHITYQILTKRPERMATYRPSCSCGNGAALPTCTGHYEGNAFPSFGCDSCCGHSGEDGECVPYDALTPLPNVWLGVSCENQETADQRIPLLLHTPAAVRFLSCEPLLAPLDLRRIRISKDYVVYDDALLGAHVPEWGPAYPLGRDGYTPLHWVIVGGESGSGARPCDVAWIRSIVQQCRSAEVACFVKQGGSANRCLHDAKGGCLSCMPVDLQIREFPNVTRP